MSSDLVSAIAALSALATAACVVVSLLDPMSSRSATSSDLVRRSIFGFSSLLVLAFATWFAVRGVDGNSNGSDSSSTVQGDIPASAVAGITWKVGIDGVTVLMLGLIGLVGLVAALVREGERGVEGGVEGTSPYPWGAASLASTGAVICVIARDTALGAMGLLASIGSLWFLSGPTDKELPWRRGVGVLVPVVLAMSYGITAMAGDESASLAAVDANRLLLFAAPVVLLPVVLSFVIGSGDGAYDRSRLIAVGILIPTAQVALARTIADFEVSVDYATSVSRACAIGGVACVVVFAVLAWIRSSPVWRLSCVVAAQTGFVLSVCVPAASGALDVPPESASNMDVYRESIHRVALIVAQATSASLLTVSLTSKRRLPSTQWLMAIGCFAVAGIPGSLAAIPRMTSILRNRTFDVPIGGGVPFTVVAFVGVAALQIALGSLWLQSMRKTRERAESFVQVESFRTLPGLPLAGLLLAAAVIVFGLFPSMLHTIGMRLR
ncbi:MAG: hypothetical protein H6832_15855 [Planctomycetes bacterium]|nr:hypothetical protein [Planctomycetota bacterium]MCB9919877.1 hypothetical protein [Planctomycetota bacterium]